MTTPLSVVHVLETAQYAGTEAHVLTLLQSLDAARVRPALVCRGGSPLHRRAEARGVPCHVCPGPWSLARLLRRERADLLHAHDGRSKVRCLLAAALAGGGCRVVATQHFTRPAYTQRGGWRGRLSAAAHRAADRRLAGLIAVSEAVRDAARARGEAAAGEMSVVHNGIALPKPPPDAGQAIRAELGIAPGAPLVCTVARLAPEKGLAHLLRAVPAVLAARPDAHFLLVGDGPERGRLARCVRDLGVGPAVHFCGFRADAPALVAASDLFVLPSLEEPFGISLLEAMALERPVVAVACGGPREIVVPGETGLLVPPADADALARAITELLGDPARRRAWGEAGGRRVRRLFAAEGMARRTEAVYAGCLARPRPAAAAEGRRR